MELLNELFRLGWNPFPWRDRLYHPMALFFIVFFMARSGDPKV